MVSIPSAERVCDDQSRETWEGPLTAVKASQDRCSNGVALLPVSGVDMAVLEKSAGVVGAAGTGGAEK